MGGAADFVSNAAGSFLGGGPDLPPGIDIERLLELQQQLNRTNTFTPFGSTTFDDEGAATFEFSPEIQAFFERATTPADIPSGSDLSADRLRVEDALFERSRRLLDPVFESRERSLRNSLSARGLPTSSEAASGEFGELTGFQRERNRSFESAALNAVLAGGQEQSRQLGEARATRGQEFGEFVQLLGGLPTVTPRPTPIDVLGPAGLSAGRDQSIFNAETALKGAKKSGLGSLGTAAILA